VARAAVRQGHAVKLDFLGQVLQEGPAAIAQCILGPMDGEARFWIEGIDVDLL
jgi:hypothetical protein